MKKLFLAATAVAAIAAAAPAAAQYDYQRDGYRTDARVAAGIENRIERLEARIEAGIRSREIDRTEAWRLRRDLAELRELERRYDNRGYTQAEHEDLRQRLRALRQQVRIADRGSWDRYERSGEWAEYDDDRFGRNAYAQGAVGFDQRIARLDARLDAGVRSREIDRREAAQLRRELAELSRIERQYGRDGFSRNEQMDLQQRIRTVRQRIRVADRGSWDRYEQRDEWAGYDDDRYGRDAFASGAAGFDQRIARLDARLDAGVRSRQINQREATQLRRELAELSRIERSYGRDGFSRNEQIDLQQRIGAVRQRIRVADRGTWDRYEQSGEWAAYDDPRGFGGRGGPDEALDRWCTDQVSDRGGIGGLIQNLFGLGGLSVGQRVSGNLYAVPYQHRGLFRDGYGVYYRSDGRVVYEIDTDTHVVTRLCRMPD